MSDEAELRLKTIVELAGRDPPPDSAEGKLLDKLVDEQIKAEKRPLSDKTLVERLRAPRQRPGYPDPLPPHPWMVEAADEIERLEREDQNAQHDIERLMDSLNKTEEERERLERELARLTSPEPPDSR